MNEEPDTKDLVDQPPADSSQPTEPMTEPSLPPPSTPNEPATAPIEPPTTPNEPATNPTQPVDLEAEMTTPSEPIAPVNTAKPVKKSKRLTVMIIVALVLLVGAALTWWMLNNTSNDQSTTDQTRQELPKLGLTATVTDGTVEYQRAADWQALAADANVELSEGDSVRTGADSRAVLTLDDGSAVRLDANTVVKLVSLAADDVKLEQLQGSIYSRIVPSDRSYTIALNETSYRALGTAFVTTKTDSVNGVQVFQSSVEVSGLDEPVTEGRQFYVANENSALYRKLTGIDLAKLTSNKFVAWNVAQDKKDAKFRDKLGALEKFDQVAKDQAAERKAEAEAKAAAAKKAAEEAERKAREAVNGSLQIGYRDGGIAWQYSGTAQYGYKVLYSPSNTRPVLRQDGTTAVYIEEPKAGFLHLPKDMKVGKTYYVRVCVYEPNNPNGPCPVYSNVMVLKRTS